MQEGQWLCKQGQDSAPHDEAQGGSGKGFPTSVRAHTHTHTLSLSFCHGYQGNPT